ncbi:SAM-dependent methyltransferase [Paracoccus sp. SY]|uniref:SAM-dependent methyltransferase n=1 Tax=Paracoccus sp. SY TaxID=1330255 RepID=UPI000CD1D4F4|nr:SAM-dependent methyltransferase [Paracoccus sp. SY]
MGKRSNFLRIERDFYPTPAEAVAPLLPHLDAGSTFIEPCAGDGALIRHLEAAGHRCIRAIDIAPQAEGIEAGDALTVNFGPCRGDICVTNPPWRRDLLHALIPHFAAQRETWLLFDADWLHTRQSAPFLPYLRKVVSVGRVKWIPGSKHTGKENAAWFCFDRPGRHPRIEFIGRTPQ